MTDADPEQDPFGEASLELGEITRHSNRVACPDVEDPSRDHEPLGRLEQRPERRQLRRPTQPERAEAKILDKPCRYDGVLLTARVVGSHYTVLDEMHYSE